MYTPAPEAAQSYQKKAQNLADVIALKEPERIPNIIVADSFILKYGGATEKDAWYNPMKGLKASRKYVKDFNLDYANVAPVYPGRSCDLFGLKLIKWPGSNVPGHTLRSEQSFQYIEGEYMTADEYDDLTADPTLYLLTKYIPRICPGLKGLEAFSGACDAVVPMALKLATSTYTVGGPPFIFIPLHKGADGFMSTEQFAKFYWPSYEKLLLAIIDAGLVPISFAEGGYNDRLDYIASESKIPAGRSMWMFDQTDMKAAKEKLGHAACIGGNVPTSLLAAGTPQEVEEYCRKLFDDAAEGGGFFLSPGAVVQDAKPENVHALLNSSWKFGVY